MLNIAAYAGLVVLALFRVDGESGGLQLYPINTIRTCLFSGGYFNTFQLKHERIATAIFQGITNALYSRDTSIRQIDFENNFCEEGLKDEGKGKQEVTEIKHACALDNLNSFSVLGRARLIRIPC